jgi:hypothetical protein
MRWKKFSAQDIGYIFAFVPCLRTRYKRRKLNILIWFTRFRTISCIYPSHFITVFLFTSLISGTAI